MNKEKEVELRWHNLKTEPPEGNGGVLLFPVITDVGHFYAFDRIHIVSNPEYARLHGIEKGYTHWFPVPKHPDEDKIREKIKKLYSADAIGDRRFYQGFDTATEAIIDFIKEIVPDRPQVVAAIEARFSEKKIK